MNTEIMPTDVQGENNVTDLVRFHSDVIDECLATSNRIKNFIKVENEQCQTDKGVGANCMIDELTNQSAKLEDLRKVLYAICSILGC